MHQYGAPAAGSPGGPPAQELANLLTDLDAVIQQLVETDLAVHQQQPELYERIVTLRTIQRELLQRAVEAEDARQRAEQALRRSETRLRVIFQGAAIGIELVDLEGRLLAFNPAVCRIFGYTEAELYAALEQTDHPVNVAYRDRNFERLRDGVLDFYTLECPYTHSTGQIVWGRVSASLVRNSSGAPQYAIYMIENITERKQMEADVLELHRRLMQGREEERLHLAQELHDGPIQDLYGLSYNLKAFADRLQDGLDAEPLKEMQNGLQRVVHTLRMMSGELRPPTLAPFGLEKAIRSHAQEFQEAHAGLAIRLNLMSDGQRLPENMRLALFRIYQVALTNVLRHAAASQVDVNLAYDEAQVSLEIRDNGQGFVVPVRWIQLARKGHLGLVGAVERAEAIGGQLEIESAPGQGACVRVRVPLDTPKAKDD
jgi:PAS domain S-box-containing protein